MTDEQTTVPTPSESAPDALYKYATWVHVGHGAEECSEVDEEAGTNRCPDSAHVHLWCRLPNPLQERDIRERALAAKARKIRQLRTDGTDANEILETELETLQAEPDVKERLVNELVAVTWAEDTLAAISEVKDSDDPDADAEGDEPVKLYAHIEDDQRRFVELQAVPEGERSQDEFDELTAHLAAYETACRAAYEAITGPRRQSYEAMDDLDLLNLVRRKRVEAAGRSEFMQHYSIHEWLSCTYREREGEPYFRDLEHLKGCVDSVLRALDETFGDLERTAQAGN